METINKYQAYFLLFSTLLNQSIKSEKAIINANLLLERLEARGNINIGFSDISLEEVHQIIKQPPILHRFPKRMAGYVYDSFWTIENCFQNNVRRLFLEGDGLLDEDLIVQNLICFRGIGMHKAKITSKIVNSFVYQQVEQDNLNVICACCPRLEETIWGELDILSTLAER